MLAPAPRWSTPYSRPAMPKVQKVLPVDAATPQVTAGGGVPADESNLAVGVRVARGRCRRAGERQCIQVRLA